MDWNLLINILDGMQMNMENQEPKDDYFRGYCEGYKLGVCEAMNLIYSMQKADEDNEG